MIEKETNRAGMYILLYCTCIYMCKLLLLPLRLLERDFVNNAPRMKESECEQEHSTSQSAMPI